MTCAAETAAGAPVRAQPAFARHLVPQRLAAQPAAAPRRQAGFTLVELAVATAVLLLGVLLACDLLSESGRLLHHSVRRARDPWTLLAAELLRNDLRGAVPPSPPAVPRGIAPIVSLVDPPPSIGIWQSAVMPLRTAQGIVVWRLGVDGRLVRSTVGGGVRAYLQDVRSFRWRQLDGNAVEVWVRYHVSSPYLRQLQGALPRSDPGEDHDLHLVVVARGGGWAQSW